MKKTTRRNNLNNNQIHILKLMYKFRFVTSSLLAQYKGLSTYRVINSALGILRDQRYIDRHFTSEYKLQRRSAEYYLDHEAIRLLRKEYGFNEKGLGWMYKNNTVNPDFIQHHLNVFQAYLRLEGAFGDDYHILTRYELAGLDYLPYPAPHLYIRKTEAAPSEQTDYLLKIYEDAPPFVIRKHVKGIIAHYEEGDWERETKRQYPTILIACSSPNTEKALLKIIERELDGAGIDDLLFRVTTVKSLLESPEIKSDIWSDPFDPETTPAIG